MPILSLSKMDGYITRNCRGCLRRGHEVYYFIFRHLIGSNLSHLRMKDSIVKVHNLYSIHAVLSND